MGLDDMFDNGEPESGPANLPASPLVHTVKTLKYPGDIFIRDADPGILYIHPQVDVPTPCDHPDLPSHIVKKSDEPGDPLFHKVEEADLQDLSAPALDVDFYRQMIRRQEDLFNRTQKVRIFDDITDNEIYLSPCRRLENWPGNRKGILKEWIHVQDLLPGIEHKDPDFHLPDHCF